MPNQDLEKILKDIFRRLKISASQRFKARYTDAKKDLKHFEESTKEDLRRFTTALADGDLTKKQFTELVGNNMRLLELKGLTQAGITVVEIDKFRHAALDIVLKTVLDKLLPI